MTVGGRGLIGLFAGYEGTMDKLFYNANLGYAQTAESTIRWQKRKARLALKSMPRSATSCMTTCLSVLLLLTLSLVMLLVEAPPKESVGLPLLVLRVLLAQLTPITFT